MMIKQPFGSRRYRILEPLGSGGMGIVYKVYDRLTDQFVALKSVMPEKVTSDLTTRAPTENYRLALAREFRLLASLRHPNIISVLDYGFDLNKHPYFTMELLERAIPITEYARHVPQEKQVELLIQMLEALAYLHRQGLVHRDLKPDNVVVVNDLVKVLDFGLAANVGQVAESEGAAGTLAYLAPEVLMGEQPTVASDLHSVGVIAYEIFAGEHPFRGVTAIDTVRRIMSQEADTDMLPLRRSLREPLAKLLAKSPKDRFANAYEIIRTYNINTGRTEAVPVRESFLRAAQFVGRKDELTRLKSALRGIVQEDQSAAPAGSAWLIGGESGVGKSRLLDELRAHALVEGVLVLRGQASSDGGSPFELWRTALRHLCLHVEPDEHDAPVLREIIPDIHTLLGREVAPAPPSDPRSTRERLVTIIEKLFRRLRTPVLLLLEDLQWAGQDLDLLQRLTEHAPHLPLLIVGAYRSDEAADLPVRLRRATSIQLQRLNEAEIAELSLSMMGESGQREDVLDLVQRESEGNVFFVVEVVRALAEDAGSMDAIGSRTLPPSVLAAGMATIIQRRLQRVPEHWRETLSLVAIAGRAVDLDVLRHLIPAGKRSPDHFLQVCQSVGVLEVHEESWRFTHDKVREQILRDLPADQRADLHRRAAEAIARIHPDDPQQAARLTYLWRQAGDKKQESYFSIRAGAQALRYGLYPQAQTWLERAELLQVQGVPVEGSELWQLLGEVHFNLGNYERAQELLRESVRQAVAADTPLASAHSHNLLGNIALALGSSEQARQHLERGLVLAQQANDVLETARILRSLGVVMETETAYAQADQYYTAALRLFEQVRDDMGIAGTYSNRASIARLQGDLIRSRDLFRSALERFESIQFAWGTAYTLTNLALVNTELADYETAYGQHERAIAICRSIGHRWGLGFCLGNLALTAVRQGSSERANPALSEAFRIAQEIRTEPLMLDIIKTYGQMLLLQGQPDQALAVLEFVLEHPGAEVVLREEVKPLLESARAAATGAASVPAALDMLATQILALG